MDQKTRQQSGNSISLPTNNWAEVALAVKNLPAHAGDVRDVGSIPGWGRFPGGGHGSPLQCSCLESPMDRGAWRATVHRVVKSWTRVKQLSTHAYRTHIQKTNFQNVSVTAGSKPFFSVVWGWSHLFPIPPP